jgi:probable F420-dependent oxidoreductase
MDFGLFMFPTDQTIGPIELAERAEEAGFESLWFPEHSHIPTSRATPWGGVKGAAPLPEWYWRTHDAFVALGAVAARTDRLRLGTGITLVPQRDPIWLAKEVATLDYLSGGRVIFGVGYGWNKEEMASHGVDYKARRAMLREKVLLMKSLWTEEVASFDGDLFDLEPSWAWPKPIQRPHPPIILGAAAGPKSIAAMVEFCDGWMPLATRHELGEHVEQVRSALSEAGRDPDAFNISAYSVKPELERLHELDRLGVNRAVFSLPQKGREEALAAIDRLTALVADFRG